MPKQPVTRRSTRDKRTGTARHPLTVSRQALMVAGSDATFRRFIHNFLAFSGRVQTIRDAFGKLVGLSGVRYSVLISIFHLQETRGVPVGMVAEHLHLGLATLTVETNKLAELGLVAKETDATDRRRVLLRLTGEGERLLIALAPIQREVNDELFLALRKNDFVKLSGYFEKLVECGDRAVSRLQALAMKNES